MRKGIAAGLVGALLLATMATGGGTAQAGRGRSNPSHPDNGRRPLGVVFVTQNAASAHVVDLLEDRFLAIQIRDRGRVPQIPAHRVEGIVLTADDLVSPKIRDLVGREFARNNTVALLDAGQADADELNALVGRRNPTVLDQPVALLALREDDTSSASMSRTHLLQYRAEGPDVGDPEAADDREGAIVAKAFQNWADAGFTDPNVGTDDGNQLTKIAHAWPTHSMKTDSSGDSLEVVNMTWAMRSFDAATDDYYYVQQEVLNTVKSTGGYEALSLVSKTYNELSTNPAPTIIDDSPGSSQSVTSITSGVNYGVGGNAGFNQSQGGILSVTPSLSVDNSSTHTVSPTTVTNSADGPTGTTSWNYVTICSTSTLCAVNNTSSTYYNRFIWLVPFSAYAPDQTTLTYTTDAKATYGTVPDGSISFDFGFNSTVPLPFNAPELAPPTVTGVDVSTATHGDTITITGTNFYLIDQVLIGGNDVGDSYGVVASDTAMNVVIPSDQPSGRNQSIIVHTDLGISPEGVVIHID